MLKQEQITSKLVQTQNKALYKLFRSRYKAVKEQYSRLTYFIVITYCLFMPSSYVIFHHRI